MYRFNKKKVQIPDIWIYPPKSVLEVSADSLSHSKKYQVSVGGKDVGISLRFPALKRIRFDKKPNQATTSQQLADLIDTQDAN